MAKYRKKPVVIEAVQFTGTNFGEIEKFCPRAMPYTQFQEDIHLKIGTLEGVMRAEVNDYIIKGVNGEFYPCKPDIFAKTYELVEEPRPKVCKYCGVTPYKTFEGACTSCGEPSK